jgi:alkanesulfonate monooxygenase SsuD/methylene tetrahydromethanopterin reductase-like flavin-dependent oxidoreductase (luciferase family)
MELGVISLSDIQTDPATGRPFPYSQRLDEIISYATLADRRGLDVFALGEHHTLDFAVSSPAVVLAAIASRTSRIRLTSGVTVLPVLDPVRVYQDFATVDLLSHGRAEIAVGRSAFTEPFGIVGADLRDYDALSWAAPAGGCPCWYLVYYGMPPGVMATPRISARAPPPGSPT